jgi:hypothetical protein
MRKMVRSGAGIFDKQEPEPHKNGPAPQHCKKCYKSPKFFILKFDFEFKNHNFVAIYFKEPFDDHLCLKKT